MLYVESINDKLSIEIDVDNDIETFVSVENVFIIKPNINYYAEVSVNYRIISFKLGFSHHLFNNFNEEI